MTATTAAVLPECDRCKRPAKRRALYYRASRGAPAILAGRYGKACFYRVAAALADTGHQVEHEDAAVIILRGRP